MAGSLPGTDLDAAQAIRGAYVEEDQAFQVVVVSGGGGSPTGGNGDPAPAFSTQVGGVGPDGNLHPVVTDNSGVLSVNVLTAPAPVGSATAANQVLEISALNALNARTAGALVPTAFDEIDLVYVPSGNGTGQVGTATYKLSSSTVATLTLTYDGSNRLSSVVKS